VIYSVFGEVSVPYKITYDAAADVLAVIVKDKGKLSHAKEVGDIILHVDAKGEPLLSSFSKPASLCL
jgi:hypothetical protein